MSLSVNRVTLSGRVSTEPERRQTHKGRPVVSFRVAVSRRTLAGESITSFIDVTGFDTVADSCALLRKGDIVAVDGSLHQDRWIGKDGTGRQRLIVSAWRVMCVRGVDRIQTREPSRPSEPDSLREPSVLDRALAWLRRPSAQDKSPVQPSTAAV